MAVETGVYGDENRNLQQGYDKRRHQRNNMMSRNDGQQSIMKYPVEYEILTMNPPIPKPPIPTAKERKAMRKEAAARQTQTLQNKKGVQVPVHTVPSVNQLVRNYMSRYDARMKASHPLSDAQREELYYQKTLGVHAPRAQDMNTAMGRKPLVLNHAYEFALKQYHLLQTDETGTLRESDTIPIVQQILANEEKEERFKARQVANNIQKWRKNEMSSTETRKDNSNADNTTDTPRINTTSTPPSSTVPSILFSKPRSVQALHIWGKRLKAVPYAQWTLGATTALDHWIACDILGMSEDSWNSLLDGELESDAQDSYGNENLTLGNLARAKDIISVRNNLFPETLLSVDNASIKEQNDYDDDLDASHFMLDEQDTKNETTDVDDTQRSIDELLASLGDFGNVSNKNNDMTQNEKSSLDKSDAATNTASDYSYDIDHTKITTDQIRTMIDSLQHWRAKNQEKYFELWDENTKKEFNKWLSEYIALVTTDSDIVDRAATRDALLSQPPSSRDESDAFWRRIQDETDAELFLNAFLTSVEKDQNDKKNETKADIANGTGDTKSQHDLDVFLSLPYDVQLRQLIQISTLRPLLDEYISESDRLNFMDQYGDLLLEGIEMEHLVLDPEGSISIHDIKDENLLFQQSSINKDSRFKIEMIPYGTDEYDSSRSTRARALYQAWNKQKAGRARYEKLMFQKGKIPLKQEKK
jgi:hypothetical protein